MDTSRHDAGRSLYGRSTARLPPGPASWPTRQGTCPIMVLRARVDAGCSQRAGPPGQLTARRDQTPGGYRMDAPGRHLRAKVVSIDHLRRRPWGRLTRSDWTLRSGFSRRTGQTRPAVWCSASAWCGRRCSHSSPPSPPCTVAMEACAGAHHWARELGKLGHTVRLIPPAYVKPYVKRHKNDRADAEAICEAAQRPNMRFVT